MAARGLSTATGVSWVNQNQRHKQHSETALGFQTVGPEDLRLCISCVTIAHGCFHVRTSKASTDRAKASTDRAKASTDRAKASTDRARGYPSLSPGDKKTAQVLLPTVFFTLASIRQRRANTHPAVVQTAKYRVRRLKYEPRCIRPLRCINHRKASDVEQIVVPGFLPRQACRSIDRSPAVWFPTPSVGGRNRPTYVSVSPL